MSVRYYDRAGQPMDQAAWIASFGDFEQKVVDKTTVGDAEVSTVWIGLDHNWGDGPPHIFETMVFGGEFSDWCYRYSTEAQAVAGHARVVDALKAGRDPDGDS